MKYLTYNRLRISLIMLSSFLLYSLELFGQQKVEGGDLSKLTLIRMAQSYISPNGKVEGLSAKKITSGEGYWVVYSDREENPTYIDKGCTKQNMRLDFLERCVVAQESEDAVRLVRFDPANQPFEDKPGSKRGEFLFKKGSESEEVGWIKKKNLLLWSNALVDDSTHYTIKAVSVKKLEEKKDITEIIKKGILDLYNSPKIEAKFDANKDINLFQYLFVFKREGNMVLLAKGNKVSASSISEDILGWADETKQLHIWDNAVCLRINFENDAIQERKDKKIDVQFFRDVNEARNFRDKGVGSSLPFYYDDPTNDEKTDNPYLLGFPIIDKTPNDKNIYKTGYVTNTISKSGSSVFTASKQAKLNSVYESIKQNKQKVNIVFVIDGSLKSMFRTITTALNSIAYVGGGSTITRNDYKLGAVIYNDAQCEEDAFKVINFMTDKDNFNEKIISESTKSSPCQLNRDVNGAPLYTAITKACDLFDNSGTTNIVIVLGATTDKDKTKRSATLQALAKKQVKMSFSQVVNREGDLYDGYIRDCKQFLQKTAESLDQQYYRDEIASGKRKAAKLLSSENYAYLENSVATGTFNWKDVGETFNAEEIKKIIRKLIAENERKMNDLLSRYEVNTTGADRGLDEGDEEQTKQLMAMFMDKGISEKDIEILASQQNFQLFIAAYAPLTTVKLKEPLLIRTLFMSRKEFDRLNETFDKLNESYSSDAMRENVVNTYKDIILKYKGGNVDLNSVAEKYSVEDFMKLVTGLTAISNNPLFKKSLAEIKNPKKTTQQEIESLKSAFYAIAKKLKEIKKNKIFRIEQEEDTFFWVPENAFQVQL